MKAAGLRPHDGADSYAAYVYDPGRDKLAFVCHKTESVSEAAR